MCNIKWTRFTALLQEFPRMEWLLDGQTRPSSWIWRLAGGGLHSTGNQPGHFPLRSCLCERYPLWPSLPQTWHTLCLCWGGYCLVQFQETFPSWTDSLTEFGWVDLFWGFAVETSSKAQFSEILSLSCFGSSKRGVCRCTLKWTHS